MGRTRIREREARAKPDKGSTHFIGYAQESGTRPVDARRPPGNGKRDDEATAGMRWPTPRSCP